MKSDTIKIDSKGNGFADAVLETQIAHASSYSSVRKRR